MQWKFTAKPQSGTPVTITAIAPDVRFYGLTANMPCKWLLAAGTAGAACRSLPPLPPVASLWPLPLGCGDLPSCTCGWVQTRSASSASLLMAPSWRPPTPSPCRPLGQSRLQHCVHSCCLACPGMPAPLIPSPPHAYVLPAARLCSLPPTPPTLPQASFCVSAGVQGGHLGERGQAKHQQAAAPHAACLDHQRNAR